MDDLEYPLPDRVLELKKNMNSVLKKVLGVKFSIEVYDSTTEIVNQILKKGIDKTIRETIEEEALKANNLVLFYHTYVKGFFYREKDLDNKIIGLRLEREGPEKILEYFEGRLKSFGLRIIKRPNVLDEKGEVQIYGSTLEGVIKKECLNDHLGPFIYGYVQRNS